MGRRRPWEGSGSQGRSAAVLYQAKIAGLQEMGAQRLIEWLLSHPVVQEDKALLTAVQKASASYPQMESEERLKWLGEAAAWWPIAAFRDMPALLRPPSLKLGSQIKLRTLIGDSFRVIDLREVIHTVAFIALCFRCSQHFFKHG